MSDATPPRRATAGSFQPGNTVGKATQFKSGNAAALRSGAYSAMVWARDRQREADLAKAGIRQSLDEACAELRTEITVRQGFPCTLAQAALVRRFQELDGMIAVIFDKVMDLTGPLTATGRAKAALDRYRALTETQAKIANLLGLPKVARRLLPDVPSTSRDAYTPRD